MIFENQGSDDTNTVLTLSHQNIFSRSDSDVCLYVLLFLMFITYSVVKQYQMRNKSAVCKYSIDFMQFKNKGLTFNCRDMKLRFSFIFKNINFSSISYS